MQKGIAFLKERNMKFQIVFIFVVITSVKLSFGITSPYMLDTHPGHSLYWLIIPSDNQTGFKAFGNESQIFTVQAPRNHRIMIVIQNLQLRPEGQIDIDPQTYLQFIDSDGRPGRKTFGFIDPGNEYIPQYLVGPRSFVSTGELASVVFTKRADHKIRFKSASQIYAKVVFTAFRDSCNFRLLPNQSDNITSIFGTQEMVYRSCSSSSGSGRNCIAAQLFCNSDFNCGDGGQGNIGFDEIDVNCGFRQIGR